LSSPTTPEEVNALARDSGEKLLHDEFSMAARFLLERDATQNFIEIGVNKGASFYLWAHFIEGIKIGIDKGQFPTKLSKLFDNVHGIVGDSHSLTTIAEVRQILNGEKVDWLFIDGDHGPGALNDYNDYKQFVRLGGFIGLHDLRHRSHTHIGTMWDELKGDKYEIKYGTGLGILQVD
jgi:hypothetical protein